MNDVTLFSVGCGVFFLFLCGVVLVFREVFAYRGPNRVEARNGGAVDGRSPTP